MSWKRGAYPEFEIEDVVAAMFILREPTGRKSLADALGIGEGSVRTMLKRLSAAGLIESTQRGHVLSGRGLKTLERVRDLFSGVIHVGSIDGYPAYALKVAKPPRFKSIALRDEAIRFMAKGALILLVRGRTPVFPEDLRPLRDTLPEVSEGLRRLNPHDGDLIVITWAEEPHNAVKSAYHVAINLKREDLPEDMERLIEV